MMALVIVAVMTMMYAVPVWAAGNLDSSTATSGDLKVDDHIAVLNLQEGDTVTFYRILKWDGDWVNDGFSLTPAQVKQIVEGTPAVAADPTANPPVEAQDAIPAGISSELAGTLAGRASSATTTKTYANVVAADDDGTVKANVANPEAGLYMAIITPAGSGYTYNPVFVAADYYADGSNEWNVTKALTYSDTGMAKKSEIPLEKTAVTTESTNEDGAPETVAVGDTVTFFVNTTIPKFSSDYTAPVFNVSDKLSTGLELETTSIEVYTGTYTTQAGVDAASDKKLTGNTATGQYTSNNPEPSKTGFTVKFKSDYIKQLGAAQEVTIVYKAKVTNEAPKSINHEDNTVQINYR